MAWQIQRTLREQRRIDHTDRVTAQLSEIERLGRMAGGLADDVELAFQRIGDRDPGRTRASQGRASFGET